MDPNSVNTRSILSYTRYILTVIQYAPHYNTDSITLDSVHRQGWALCVHILTPPRASFITIRMHLVQHSYGTKYVCAKLGQPLGEDRKVSSVSNILVLNKKDNWNVFGVVLNYKGLLKLMGKFTLFKTWNKMS